MTRGTIRTLLRKKLNEDVADQWSEDVLSELIDAAYGLVQAEIRRLDPQGLVFWSYADIVSGTQYYEKPAGTWGQVSIRLKDAITLAYGDTPLQRIDYDLALKQTTTSTPFYFERGRYIGLVPIPSASITQGIEFQHVPTETLALDTDTPQINVSYHYAIVLEAAIMAKDDTTEDVARLRASRDELYSRMALAYPTAMDQNQVLRPDVEMLRRGGRLRRVLRGVDSGPFSG